MAEPPMPDLSHLSAEEREIIEQVFKRQRAEEEKEVQITQKADEELENIEKQINDRKETAKKLVGTQDDAICQICQKTKFADGIGHKCFYCQLRSCARCGGRTQSKNKAIWACSLCQKRQQILMKTGKWFQPEDQKCVSPSPSTSAGMNSPPLESSPLPGQMGPSPSQSQHVQNHLTHQQSVAKTNGGPPPHIQGPQNRMANQQPTTSQMPLQPQSQQQQRTGPGLNQSARGPDRNDPKRTSVDSINRQSSQEQRQQEMRRQSSAVTARGSGVAPRSESNRLRSQASIDRERENDRLREEERRREEDRRYNQQQRPQERRTEENTNRPVFYTESEDRLDDRGNREREIRRSPSPRITQKHLEERRNSNISSISDRDRDEVEERRRRNAPGNRRSPRDMNPVNDLSIDQQYGSTNTTTTSQENLSGTTNRTTEFRRNRNPTRTEEENRRPSVSGRPAVVEAVPREGSTHRHKKNRLHRQLRSMSSSEEEMPSTSDGFSGEEALQRVPNECTSEKDLLRYIYGSEKMKNGRKSAVANKLRPADEPSASKPNVIPGDMLAAKIRTYLSHPVTWQPSADQRRLIGHMILHRTDSVTNGDLGLKVVGGRRTDAGRLGAFITRVRTGSVADTIGRLRPGDEVLEWNGENLQNSTFDQVYEIIAASKNDSQIELIVSRSTSMPGGDDFLNVHQPTWTPPISSHTAAPLTTIPQRVLPNPQFVAAQEELMMASPSASPLLPNIPHSQSAILPHLHMLQTSPRHKASASYFTPVPTVIQQSQIAPTEVQFAKGQIFGRIELALFYSMHDRQLTVTLIRALDLPPRPDGVPRNPYVKIFLLPDRSEKSRRQSAVLAETVLPVWNENFYYHGLTEPMMMERVLEVTVWDYDKYETNSFLGETLIDFSSVPLDAQPLLYTLVDMDEEDPLRSRLRNRRMSPYSSMPTRPRSEMGGYYASSYGSRHALDKVDHHGYDYTYDGVPGPRQQLFDAGMRRSRTYDRAGLAGRMTPVRTEHREVRELRPEDDWTQNSQSGYLSDHGYTQPVTVQRYRHRRPRSATAMRPMTAAEMSASRMYNRNLPSEPYYEQELDSQHGQIHPQSQQQQMQMGYPQQQMMNHQQIPSNSMQQRYVTDPRSPNGRIMMEGIEGHQGYGSDGSETISINSAHSMPTVRTINRRRPPESESEDRQEEYNDESHGGGQGDSKQQQAAKERKKSLMTRLIPGRNAPLEGKRTGFARSEEVGIPENLSSDRLQTTPFLKQTSKESTDSSHSDNWLPVLPDGPLGTFVDNLGPGQVVGRQVLASPVLGEIQIGIMAGRAGIDVEIIRAKNLVVKPGTKINPAPYVKVYLMEGKQCIAKAKTNPVRKTTAPLFQQHLIFNDTPKKKMLQITVLGDYGRMERKSFMGIAQIRLDDLELGPEPIIGWYKLYHSSSLAGTGPIRKDSETSLVGGQ